MDNPDLFGVLYLSDSPAGAVAEHFGWLGMWSAAMFKVGNKAPGARYVLARFATGGRSLLNLDDPSALLERDLRPSSIVTNVREVTQAWSRAAFEENRWAGVQWWSRWDARWASIGMWDVRSLRLSGKPEHLTPTHAAVLEAADVLNRSWR